MTMPIEYRNASKDFEKFLREALNQSGLATTNQVYTMVQGVLQCFRRRLTTKQVLHFAGALPPVLRAILVDDWDLDEPKRPFSDRQSMTREVQSLRRDHNFAPPTAIRDVALALRNNVDQDVFNRALAMLPPGAAEFWTV